MQISVPRIPAESGYRLIPVASELLNDVHATEVNFIVSGNESWEVHDYYAIPKHEVEPKGLQLLSMGILAWDEIWKKYIDSDRLYFFICKKKIG